MGTGLLAPLKALGRALTSKPISPVPGSARNGHGDTALLDALVAFMDVVGNGASRGWAAAIPAAKVFRELVDDAKRPLTVLVMGHFKTGKSSFLNALLGEALLSTDVLPATAAVTVLTFGPERRLRAHFADRPPQVLSFETLNAISSESGAEWAETRRGITHLEVALPHPLLESVTLVDTPGLNSAHEQHSQVTKAFVDRADAIIWLFGFPQTCTRTELEEIRSLPPGFRPYAIVNQIDRLDPDEQSEEEFLDRVSRSLGTVVHQPVAISAKLALAGRNGGGEVALQSSGWHKFVEILERDIIGGKSRQKTSRLLDRAVAALDLIGTPSEAVRKEVQSAAQALCEDGPYTRNLQERMEALAVLDRSWRLKTDQDSSDLILTAADLSVDVDECAMLTRDREVLKGMLDGIAAEATELEQESRSLDTRRRDYNHRVQAHNRRLEEYNHSGVFGGPPILGGLFDGGEGENINRSKAELDRELAEINVLESQLQSRGESFESRLAPIQRDCDEFVEQVHQAIIRGVEKLEYDLDHRLEVRARAAESIRKHGGARETLAEIARRALPALAHAITRVDPCIPGVQQIAARIEQMRSFARDIDDAVRKAESYSSVAPQAGRMSLRIEAERHAVHGTGQKDTVSRRQSWNLLVPASIGAMLAAAAFGVMFYVASMNRPAPAFSTTTQAIPSPAESNVPDARSIRALSFPSLPQNDGILKAFYGNTRGIRGAAIWSADRLPRRLDLSRLQLQGAEDGVHFRVAFRQEHNDGQTNRLLIAVAGTGARGDDTFIDCHACGALLGVIILREHQGNWTVQAADRAIAVFGDSGRPADSYSVVKMGSNHVGLMLRKRIMNQGYGADRALLISAVDRSPRIVADLNTGITNCGAVGEVACRSESAEISFIEAPGESMWDMQVQRNVTAGLRVGEPAFSLQRFHFDGKVYREVAATHEAQAGPDNTTGVLATLEKWRWATVSRDVDALLSLYPPLLERYYLQTNYTWQQVRESKLSFFRRYPIDVKCEFSNIQVEFVTPTRALLSFRKDWEVSGPAKSSGTVRTELIMASTAGEWKIVSELDRNP